MKNGYFANNEFVITNMKPRRFLYNYLWNDMMVCQCDHFGNGYCFKSDGVNRRDIENGDRNIYIKNHETGEVYSANRNHDDLPFNKHECRVGLGYQTIISEYKGLRVEFSILVASDFPALLFNVKIRNISKKTIEFDAIFENVPKPDLSWHAAYSYAGFDKDLNGLLFTHEGYHLPSDFTKTFVSCDKKFNSFETSYSRFLSLYNGFRNPEALKHKNLSSLGSTFDANVAAFQFNLSLNSGEEFETTFVCATARTKEECIEIKNKFSSFEKEKAKQIDLNDGYIDTFKVETPDSYLNEQVNVWFKRQLSLGKTWGRLYGKGFRDVMQDIAAFVSFDTKLAKEKILNALKHQYEDGNPIRMFEPNFRYPYNDGGVWIPETVLAYINESGDKDFLNIDVPYLEGDSYNHVSYADAFVNEEYKAGKRKGNVLDHVQAGVDYLLNCRGQNNLVLWRGGDWNDSMNNVGNKGIGESVWLSIATVKAVNDFIEILKIIGKTNEISTYLKKRDELKVAINKAGKSGDHYIYGINDDHEVIGGQEMMFLNPQSWAVFAGLGDENELNKMMDEVEMKLKCDFGYVQCSPSFNKGRENVGRISYFKPGLVENGGVYNHGVAFKIIADCLLNRNDLAYQTIKLISADNPRLANSGVEPYAVSNMYLGPEEEFNPGFAPMFWITGTAGWLYRAVSEHICGVKASIDGLRIEPHLPSHWDEIKVSRIFRGCEYQIQIKRGEGKGLYVEGKKLAGTFVPLSNKKVIKCEVII